MWGTLATSGDVFRRVLQTLQRAVAGLSRAAEPTACGASKEGKAGTGWMPAAGGGGDAMSAARVLPSLYAASDISGLRPPVRSGREGTTSIEESGARPAPELAFYRKYTEALLRRYLRMSLQLGRVPSMLGQEMFRGRVTGYQARSFEDMVIFVHDMERCLNRLDRWSQDLIGRIALQQYTQEEAAELIGQNKKAVVKGYGRAIDRLTSILLEVEILFPEK